mmetsp:Transcript_15871/g.24424  ORF Transcript_15871/g.24424 Transcript_15871/m.24424 type:complete len:252 (-) Transcript_15871:451-1206(-)
MVSHRLEQLVDGLGNGRLQVARMKSSGLEVSLNVGVGSVELINVGLVFLSQGHDEAVLEGGHHHVLHVIDDRVLSDNSLGAEALRDLSLNVLGRVLHEDGGVGVGLAHLSLALLQAHQHVVREDHWLHRVCAVVPSEHVHFTLVKTELAHVGLQEEHVSALHARVEHLGGRHIVTFTSSHDGAALLDTGDVVRSADVHDTAPVLVWPAVDLFRSPKEADVAEVHACGLPHFNEVAANNLNLVEVATHLVVE